MKKERVCVIIAAAVIAVSCAAIAVGRLIRPNGHTAYVYSDGRLIETIDLDSVTQPYTFTVGEGTAASNTISVNKGEIGVVGASCPDKICVSHGFISSAADPIICMPNRLVITVGNGSANEVDAVAE